MEIGFACMDITPSLGIELGGYGYYPARKAEKLLDPLYARAVCFRSGGVSFVIINCDLIGLDDATVAQVKNSLHDDLDIDKSNIILFSIHTHTGPAIPTLIGCGESDPHYMSNLPKLLIQSVGLAMENFRVVQNAKHFSNEIESIGFNRAHIAGLTDTKVKGIVFCFKHGRPLVLISHGCHPVTLGAAVAISADYPGRVVKYLAKAGFDGIFLTGFCGDIDPLSNKHSWGSGTVDTINQYGKRIAEAFIDNREKGSIILDWSIKTFEMTVSLKLQNFSLADIENKLAAIEKTRNQNPGHYKAVEIWAEKMKERLRLREDPYTEILTLQALKIDKAVIVGFPAEVFFQLGPELQKALPELNVMLIGNANATLRYIPDKRDILNQGYASLGSSMIYQTLPLVPGEGELMMTETAKALCAFVNS